MQETIGLWSARDFLPPLDEVIKFVPREVFCTEDVSAGKIHGNHRPLTFTLPVLKSFLPLENDLYDCDFMNCIEEQLPRAVFASVMMRWVTEPESRNWISLVSLKNAKGKINSYYSWSPKGTQESILSALLRGSPLFRRLFLSDGRSAGIPLRNQSQGNFDKN